MLKALRLIRAPNIIIIFLTQGILYFGLLLPSFRRYNIVSEMQISGFIQMFSITAIIAICGYLINDILDLPIDRINRKEKALLGSFISISQAKQLYFILLIIGFLLSFLYAWQHNTLSLLFIYPSVCALLAFYSSHLKGIGYSGNVIVSLFSGCVAGIVLLFEIDSINILKYLNPALYAEIMLIFKAFIIFAFLSSLFREIIKDIEDMEGDKEYKLKTGAILLGLKGSRFLSILIAILLSISLVIWMCLDFNRENATAIIFGGFILVFVIFSIMKLLKAHLKSDFSYISNLIKGIMFLGLIYLFLYTFHFQ